MDFNPSDWRIFQGGIFINKVVKALFAVFFALGAVTAFNANGAEASADDGQESKEAYYHYNGHTGYNQDGAFIVDRLFIDGLADNNFILNGYQINAHPDANDEHSHTLGVYDQTLYVNTDGQVYRASFPVNDSFTDPYATIADIEAAYGEPEESTLWYGDGAYYYFVGDAQITFSFTAGLVTHVYLGSYDLPEDD